MSQCIKPLGRHPALIATMSVFLLLGALTFALACEYCFERVQVRGIAVPKIAPDTIMQTAKPAKPALASGSDKGTWSVSAQTADITIAQITRGTGAEALTFYVADITVQSGKAFSASFAKDEFGQNIREKTSSMARRAGAAFAFNGDYYGYRDDGIVIRNGVLYRDTPSDRAGMAISTDGRMSVYREGSVTGEELLAEGAWNTYSFGPVLVKDGAGCEGLDKPYGVDTTNIHKRQPRTAIGMISPGHFVVMVADGRQEGYSRGMTFVELAEVFDDLHCQVAYNLDGGNSATLFADGAVVNHPSSKYKERAISDAICIF